MTPTATVTAPNTGGRLTAAEATCLPFRDVYPFKFHFFVQPDGKHQHYVDEGPRDAPVLLCMHGNPTWSFYYRSLIKRFSATHRVVVPDHIGCGLSDKPQDYPYTLEQHIDNAERLADALGLDRVTLIAHDWGGAIGMGLAVRRPERIQRLVLSNTAAFRSKRMPWRIGMCRVPGLGPLLVRRFNGFSWAATHMAVERRLGNAAKRGLVAPYADFESRVAIHAFVKDIPLGPKHRSYATLEAIEAGLNQFRDRPALLVWGERDWCFTPRFRAQWERHLPEATVVALGDVGHYVLEDAPERALEAIETFLSDPPMQ